MKNINLEYLKVIRTNLEDALAKVNEMIASMEGFSIVRGNLYIMPCTPAEIFDRTQFWCRMAEKRGNNLQIEFHEEAPVVRVVMGDPNDDQHSWTDHGLPEEIVTLMGLDKEHNHYAPSYIPAALVENLDTGDDLVLEPTNNLKIILHVQKWQGVSGKDTFKEVFLDNLQRLVPMCKSIFKEESIAASERARVAFNIGLCYEKGIGVDVNTNKALDWFKQAADLGNKRASWRIGRE